MLGAAGALCCLLSGTGIGFWLRERKLLRLRMLRAEMDALSCMRMLLEQERPPLPELLAECAAGIQGSEEVRKRFRLTARFLTQEPMAGTAGAYASACAQIPMPWEETEEKIAMETLFRQLGSGTAAMREQAAAACLRRMKPLAERACEEVEKSGRLCVQLGMLLGLMAGIALW